MVVKSNIVIGNELVSYEFWESYIDGLKKNSASLPKLDNEQAVKVLKEDIEQAVKNRIPNKRFGIFFSGGVDSTLIAFLCKKHSADFVCFTVGIKGSKDLKASKLAAKELSLEHMHKTLLLEEMEPLFKKTAQILKEDLNVVNLGVGSVELAAIELAKKQNIDILFGGLGSEEIFAGYRRHETSDNINEECWKGLKTTYERDFKRDFKIAGATKTEFLTPFLDKKLIVDSMRIPGNLKISKGYKKYILREAALSLGLRKEFSFRPKKAAQYGSSFDKALEKIAKSKGFRYKKQYLKSL